MLNKMSLSLAQTFYTNADIEYDEGDIEVYAYGLEVFLSSVLEVLAILIIGIFVGRIFEALAFFISFIPLRSFAGGYHAKTHLRCFFVLLVVYGLVLLILNLIPISFAVHIALICVGLSVFPILKFAPLADVNKPIGVLQRKEFRKKSVFILLVQAIIIIGLSGLIIMFNVSAIISYICLSFALGQLSAVMSLVVAKIRNIKHEQTAPNSLFY